jgi:hypothetical protein
MRVKVIAEQLRSYFQVNECEPLSFIEATSSRDFIYIHFLYKKRKIEIEFYISENYLSISKKIPTKDPVVVEKIEQLLNDIINFIKEKSEMRLNFLLNKYEINVYGSPYNPITRKIKNWFDTLIIYLLFTVVFSFPLFILYMTFHLKLLTVLCLLPVALSIPLIVDGAIRYTMGCDAKIAERAKMQIVYAGIGFVISFVALIFTKIVFNI